MVEGIIDAINEVKNPYPKDVFIEPSKANYRKASKLLLDNGFSPDALFGAFAYKVWENCREEIMESLKDFEDK